MKSVLVVLAGILVLCGASTREANLNKKADALINDLGDDGMAKLGKFLSKMSGKQMLASQDDSDDDVDQEMVSQLVKMMSDVGDGDLAKGNAEGDDDLGLAQAVAQEEEPQATMQRRYVRISYRVWCIIRRFYYQMYRRYGRKWRG